MPRFVEPKVFFVGATVVDPEGLREYLKYTGNEEFQSVVDAAMAGGCTDAEVLISLMAKLCYKSLTLGQNANISRTRDIPDNVANVISTGHGSVLEHFNLSFIITDCSRVFTHEIVRHRAGWAFSQTSGRYVRSDEIALIFDPILEPIRAEAEELLTHLEGWYNARVQQLGLDQLRDFTAKKKLTSALRRFMPNGQGNEIGCTCNLRALRHTLMLRTGTGVEWEARKVFSQIYHIVKERYPLLVADAKTEEIDGATRVYGMTIQPYEEVDMGELTVAAMAAELATRGFGVSELQCSKAAEGSV